jgi:hypothetical protein
MRHFTPVPDLSVTTLANAFISEVYRLHGSPSFITSDRGTQFVSAFWAELNRRLGVTLRPSTAFHPETDGQTEIINAAIEQYLRCFCSFYQDDWVDWLPIAEFSANNQTSESTGLSPFFANYGWHPQMGTEPSRRPVAAQTATQQREFLQASTVADRIERLITRTKAFMAEAQERHEHYANNRRSDAETFTIGDLVWICTKNLRTSRPVKKLDAQWIGPYPVTKVYRRAVAVDLPAERRIFPVFHTSLIQRDKGGYPGQDTINSEYDRQADGAILTENDEEEWFFETILNSRLGRHGLEYKIKWPAPHRPTWEPAENIKGCDSDIAVFHANNPGKPGPPTWWSPQGSASNGTPTSQHPAAETTPGPVVPGTGVDPPAPPAAGPSPDHPRPRRSARLVRS